MTTLGLTMASRRRKTHLVRNSSSMVQPVLLWCGILSSLLYIATDILGGLRYEGYSFTSQAISELMAIGAPSERFVDPLFIVYSALVLAFAIGLWHERVGRDGALRIVAVLLIGYAALGFTGPTFFEMSQRGAGSLPGDRPHIILTAVLVVLLLLAIGLSSFAFGKRFRAYALATLLVVFLSGAMTAPYAAQIAAGEPTPGFGIIERITIYTTLAWIAGLAIAVLRRRDAAVQPPLP